MTKKKVLILGAGVAGLAAGLELSRNSNFEIIILEKDKRVGGMAQTIRNKDFRFDLGGHRWFTKNDFVDEWVKDLLKGRLIKVKRSSRIYFEGKYFFYPMRVSNIFQLGLFRTITALFDFINIRLKSTIHKPKIVTIKDAYINQFGNTLYKTFFAKYHKKLWGLSCEQMAADWVVQRSRKMSILTVLLDMFFKTKGKVQSLVGEFLIPKLGMGELPEKMSQEIIKKGGKIYTSAEVVLVENKKNKFLVDFVKSNKKESLKADYLISSIPITNFVLNLQPSPHGMILEKIKKLKYRSMIFVALFINKIKVSQDSWVYVHPENICFVRFHEIVNWSKYMAPKNKTCLVFEIPCSFHDETWNLSDNKLINMVKDNYINEFKLIKERDILGGIVYRQNFTYPIYDLDYQKNLEKIKRYLGKFRNLQLIGRNGMFRYNNMDHSILSGIWAARNLTGGNFDLNKINIEQEYHEEKS